MQLIGLVDYTSLKIFKEVHLVTTPSLQTSFERVHWCCIHIFLRQTVPMVDDSLWEELKTGFTVTEILQKFPTDLWLHCSQKTCGKIHSKEYWKSIQPIWKVQWDHFCCDVPEETKDQAGKVYHHMASFEVQCSSVNRLSSLIKHCLRLCLQAACSEWPIHWTNIRCVSSAAIRMSHSMRLYQGHVNHCVTFNIESLNISETVGDGGLIQKYHQ